MPGPWEDYGGESATPQPPWADYGGKSDKVGIRPASGWEEVKSKFHRFTQDPVGFLSENQHPDTQSVDETVPYWLINGMASGEGVAARTAKNLFTSPPSLRGAGRLAKAVQSVKGAYKDAVNSANLARESQEAARNFDSLVSQAPAKAPVSSTPKAPTTGSGRPLTADELAFQQAGTTPGPQPEPYTAPEPPTKYPRIPARVESSPKPVVDATPIKPPQGYVRKSPINLGDYPPKPVRAPAARVELQPREVSDATPIPPQNGVLPSGRKVGGFANQSTEPIIKPPNGVDPVAWSKLPQEVKSAIQEGARKKAAGQGYKPAPTPEASNAKAVPEDPYIYQEDGKPLMKKGSEAPDDLPPAGTPKRAPRSTAEAQQRSDEIAALNRHADTVPLAQKAVQDGVTSKDLLALPPEAKADFMKRIGLEGRSDATWRTFVGHVLRLEKLGKK